MSRHLAILGLSILFLVFGALFFNALPKALHPERADIAEARIALGGKNIIAEIVDTPAARIRGLSGRTELPEDRGMLFVFDEPAIQGFWMKDMNFPIDIIWIEGGVVAGVVSRASPDNSSSRPIYYSPIPVSRVLEVPAGTAETLGIVPGTLVQISAIK